MCFSAEASFVAAAALATIGAVSVSQAPYKRAIPFALLPFLLALHQAIEGMIWLNVARTFFSYLFLILATAVWPVWIPVSLYLLEEGKKRKRWMSLAAIVGVVVGIVYLLHLASTGSTTTVINHHISYSLVSYESYSWSFENLLVAGYCFAVIVSFFLSSLCYVWLIGVFISLGLIVSAIFYFYALGSVWCFFGALSSSFVALVVWKLKKQTKNCTKR
jgi:hypothetical protein